MDKATTIKLLKEGFEGIEKFASECVDILENSEESQIDWSQLEILADKIHDTQRKIKLALAATRRVARKKEITQ